MNKIIQKKLLEIEKKENIKILHCVESGSRAWGFASPDSDYDVRFIYVRNKNFYLRIDETRDVIEWQLDDTLDINGWDLKKTLQLLYKSNPTVFEWNASPIVYQTTKEWEQISTILNDYFVAKKGLYHYLSTAKSNYRTYLKGDNVRYKKYFYVLRPILACKWILKEGTPPPMLFKTLMDNCLEKELFEDVLKLLDLKVNSPEIAEGKPFSKVNEYMDKSILEIEEIVKTLPDRHDKNWEDLNKIFINNL